MLGVPTAAASAATCLASASGRASPAAAPGAHLRVQDPFRGATPQTRRSRPLLCSTAQGQRLEPPLLGWVSRLRGSPTSTRKRLDTASGRWRIIALAHRARIRRAVRAQTVIEGRGKAVVQTVQEISPCGRAPPATTPVTTPTTVRVVACGFPPVRRALATYATGRAVAPKFCVIVRY